MVVEFDSSACRLLHRALQLWQEAYQIWSFLDFQTQQPWFDKVNYLLIKLLSWSEITSLIYSCVFWCVFTRAWWREQGNSGCALWPVLNMKKTFVLWDEIFIQQVLRYSQLLCQSSKLYECKWLSPNLEVAEDNNKTKSSKWWITASGITLR